MLKNQNGRGKVMVKNSIISCAIFLVALGVFSSPSQATLVYSFDIFTDNGYYNDSDRLNFSVEVSGAGEYVSFKIRNQSTDFSSISAIYFDDKRVLGGEHILGEGQILEGPDTDFKPDAKPTNLPGGNLLDPVFPKTDKLFSSGTTAPRPFHGINPGQ